MSRVEILTAKFCFSAYCGGLWLAAVYVMIEMADFMGKKEDRDLFQGIFDKGKASFDRKMWNGQYYNFDSSHDEKNAIMADQLCGHWYLRCCGIKNYDVSSSGTRNIGWILKIFFSNRSFPEIE